MVKQYSLILVLFIIAMPLISADKIQINDGSSENLMIVPNGFQDFFALEENSNISGGGGTPSGGGGGTTVGHENNIWIMNITQNNVSVPLGTSRKLSIDFENLGDSSREITLSCKNIEGSACQYVSFEESPFTLPKNTSTKQYLTITFPNNAEKKQYQFNVIGKDDLQQTGYQTVYINADLKAITNIISKINSSTKNRFPYWLIFVITFIISISISGFLLRKSPNGILLAIFISFIVATLSLVIF